MNDESDIEDNEDQPAKEFVAELIDDVEHEVVEEIVPATLSDPTAVAVAAPVVAYNPSILVPPKPASYEPPPSPMANLSAKGGAVGAVVLGVLSFIGSFITSYAILNSFLGLALGLWGLRSNHRSMAVIGMAICLISAFLCVLDISEWLQGLWVDPEFQ